VWLSDRHAAFAVDRLNLRLLLRFGFGKGIVFCNCTARRRSSVELRHFAFENMPGVEATTDCSKRAVRPSKIHAPLPIEPSFCRGRAGVFHRGRWRRRSALPRAVDGQMVRTAVDFDGPPLRASPSPSKCAGWPTDGGDGVRPVGFDDVDAVSAISTGCLSG